MIRIAELKLPLSALPVEERRAADAPTETEADRAPAPHPVADLHVFKRSFDARKAELRAVFICDVTLTDPAQEA